MTTLRLVAAATIATLASAPAFAADLPDYAPPAIVAVPSFSWTGFYIGATAGYVWGDHDIRTSGQDAATRNNVALNLRPGKRSIDGDGFTVGGTIGYNYQFDNSPLVVGVEADLSYTDVDATNRYAITPNPGAGPGTIRSSFKQELDYLGTVRARLGYAFGRFLVFGTGGLAYGEVKTSARFINGSATGVGAGLPNAAGAVGFSGSKSNTEYGYAVGGGLEYALTDNISVKGEYLYYDLGDTKINVNNTGLGPTGQAGYRSKFENDGHLVRAGVNYRF